MNILSNKTAKTSNYFSRYNGFYYYYNKLDGKYQLSTKAWLKQNDNYKTYVVKEKDTYDSIALNFYNNPTYYWVICDFNHVVDPMIGPNPGDILYLPTLGTNLDFEVY